MISNNTPLDCGIYAVVNKINGDYYIGQSIHIRARLAHHFYTLKHAEHYNSRIQAAFIEFGEHNFIFKILLHCEPFELTRYEQACLDVFHPNYNISKKCVDSTNTGGTHSVPEDFGSNVSKRMKGKHPSEETRHRMSLSHTGKKHTEEEKQKMSVWQKGKLTGRPSSRKGIPLPEETKRKLSLAMTGRTISKEHAQALHESRRGKSSWNKGMPAWNRGLKHSEEDRKKMSDGCKRTYQRKRAIKTVKDWMRYTQIDFIHSYGGEFQYI